MVVTDASVLIDLIHVDALAIVAGLPEYEFVIADAVVEEIIAERPRVIRVAPVERSAK